MGKILGGYLYPHPPIIIAEIGRGEELKAKATIEGVKALSQDIKEKSPDTIIVVSPHGPLFSDAISISMGKTLKGDFKSFGRGDLKFSFSNNRDMVGEIIRNANEEGIVMAEIDGYFVENYNVSTDLDHGVLVPLYFVDKVYQNFNLIHITYGLLSPLELYSFGMAVQKAIEDSKDNAIIIASGDLSHKLFKEDPADKLAFGRIFDESIVEILEESDMEALINFDLDLAEKAQECGLRSLMIMAGSLDGYKLDSKVYSYEGPYGVGYATAKLEPLDKNKSFKRLDSIKKNKSIKVQKIREDEDAYVRLARKSIEHYLEYGDYLEIPQDLPKELIESRKPVFVTLKKHGNLRGCIGSLEARRENTAMEIIMNAVGGATEDPRFPQVEKSELEDLVYSVDVLSQGEDVSSLDELDPLNYGIIVEAGFKKGLLLPNIDGVDTVEDQLSIALEKAGIGKEEDYSIKRFKVVRHQ